MRLKGLALTLACGCAPLAAWGQQPTTVQLPTFRFFTVQTTVSVPDSGGSLLGGILRGREGSVTRGFGPLRSRGIGSDRGAGTMSVHATIIDHRAMDEALLAEAAVGRTTAGLRETALKAADLSSNVARYAPSADMEIPRSSTESVAAIREQNAVAASQRASAAAEFLAKGQAAESAGKIVVARVHYQMAARRDEGQIGTAARARLAAMETQRRAADKP